MADVLLMQMYIKVFNDANLFLERLLSFDFKPPLYLRPILQRHGQAGESFRSERVFKGDENTQVSPVVVSVEGKDRAV
jgi:hypothetical protein